VIQKNKVQKVLSAALIAGLALGTSFAQAASTGKGGSKPGEHSTPREHGTAGERGTVATRAAEVAKATTSLSSVKVSASPALKAALEIAYKSAGTADSVEAVIEHAQKAKAEKKDVPASAIERAITYRSQTVEAGLDPVAAQACDRVFDLIRDPSLSGNERTNADRLADMTLANIASGMAKDAAVTKAINDLNAEGKLTASLTVDAILKACKAI
jgi:hypothetical protein